MILFACFFGETVCAVGENFRGVCFLEEEEAGELDCGVGDGDGPEYPAPAYVFSDKTARDWAYCWAEEGSETVDS